MRREKLFIGNNDVSDVKDPNIYTQERKQDLDSKDFGL